MDEISLLKLGGIGLAGYTIGLAFKTIERIMGKINYTTDAKEFLADHARKLEEINESLSSQKEIMDDLKDYARQNAENAVKMSSLIEVMVRRV